MREPLDDDSASEALPPFFALMLDFIQLYAFNERPSLLRLTSTTGEVGELGLVPGRLVYASCGPRHGVEALRYIMSWEQGHMTRAAVAPPHENIDQDLNDLLLDLYWSSRGDDVPPPLVRDTELAEITEPPDSQEVIVAESLWGERLRRSVKATPGVVYFALIDERSEIDVQSSQTEATRAASMVPLSMVQALRMSGLGDDEFEVLLNVPGRYHIFTNVPQRPGFILYVIFDRAGLTMAMAQWRVRQLIEELSSASRS